MAEKKKLAELRKELKELRKEAVKPVSRMRKGDISAEIERMRGMRAETPAAAAVPSAPLMKSKAAVESVKEAKAKEFPMIPSKMSEKKEEKKEKPKAAPKKKSKLDRLMEMMDGMSDTDEE